MEPHGWETVIAPWVAALVLWAIILVGATGVVGFAAYLIRGAIWFIARILGGQKPWRVQPPTRFRLLGHEYHQGTISMPKSETPGDAPASITLTYYRAEKR